ncbi:hypothetical protein [Zunongwangia pacifica]|uniref:Uncharacterized protein n=1 Tax=Zunongwangia pacifica TaxID=2911062 RepID=A0A9X2A1Z2_9FLAO|nr:hypothetical protein [Zunongwangia pacifica]MCL6220601.1 hypothetical protein [Zunongwangia pacifica]
MKNIILWNRFIIILIVISLILLFACGKEKEEKILYTFNVNIESVPVPIKKIQLFYKDNTIFYCKYKLDSVYVIKKKIKTENWNWLSKKVKENNRNSYDSLYMQNLGISKNNSGFVVNLKNSIRLLDSVFSENYESKKTVNFYDVDSKIKKELENKMEYALATGEIKLHLDGEISTLAKVYYSQFPYYEKKDSLEVIQTDEKLYFKIKNKYILINEDIFLGSEFNNMY